MTPICPTFKNVNHPYCIICLVHFYTHRLHIQVTHMYVARMTLFDNSAYNTDNYQECAGHITAYTITLLHTYRNKTA